MRAFLERLLWAVVALACGLAVGTFLIVAGRRLGYPLELEWMEGGVLDHVRRIVAGAPLYAPPSVRFTAFVYPPLYYLAVAAIASFAPLGFAAARALSLAATAGILAGVFALVLRETSDRIAASVAVGLVAAAYGVTGFWYDLARPDTLALGLAVGAILCLRFARSRRGAGAAGLLLAASVFGKQTLLILAVALLLGGLAISVRRARAAAVTFAAALAAGVGLLEWASRGWFLFYAVELPMRQGWSAVRAPELLGPLVAVSIPGMVLAAAALSLAPGISSTGLMVPDRALQPSLARFYGPVVLGAVATSSLARVHPGGARNAWIPAVVGLAVASGLACGWVRRGATSRETARPSLGPVLVALLVLCQLALFAYDPRRAVPDRADRACAEVLFARLGRLPADTWMPAGGFYRHLAGRPGLDAHAYALSDVFRARGLPQAETLLDDLVDRVRRRRYHAVVLGTRELETLPDAVAEAVFANYAPSERLLADPRCAFPRSGFPNRPELVLTPVDGVAAAPGEPQAAQAQTIIRTSAAASFDSRSSQPRRGEARSMAIHHDSGAASSE